MKKLFKKLPLIVIGALLLFAIVMSFQPKPVEVDLAKVDRGDVRLTVNEDGRTRIIEKYTVSAPLSGRLHRIHLKPGMPVLAGTTRLAIIEPTEPALLDARARAEARARVAAAQASVERSKSARKRAEAAYKQATANRERAEAEVTFTRDEHERIKKLFDKARSASERELATAYFDMRRAEQELRAAQFAIQVADQEKQSATFSIKVAEHKLEPHRPHCSARKNPPVKRSRVSLRSSRQ